MRALKLRNGGWQEDQEDQTLIVELAQIKPENKALKSNLGSRQINFACKITTISSAKQTKKRFIFLP